MNGSLVLVLGDQLSTRTPVLDAADKRQDIVLMAEVSEEATYVAHHKKKIAFVFAAMRHFAGELRQSGWHVDYIDFDAAGNTGTIVGEVERAVERHGCRRVLVTAPGEWRLEQAFVELNQQLAVPVEVLEDDRFLCSRETFARWAAGRKQLRMEHFYREMRLKTGLLMDGDQPEGGRWNYDRDNRKPPKKRLVSEGPMMFPVDDATRDVLGLVSRRFKNNFGDLEPFWFAVTREHAESAFDHFVKASLAHFGDYQDAMLASDRFLYHAVISLYLNIGLLDPLDVCRRVEAAYAGGEVPLNAAEGFIRQIIGWREFVRGVYWLSTPDYVDRNVFGHTRSLPWFYWSGDTDMACLRACIDQTRTEAYAHHIQRLMVTGNFAMLAGVDPKAVHEWYLAVYADAYEWVELPNTLGMSQFADGGMLASKPYAASGNYISRMSDYCASCRFDVRRKEGPEACPFNYLYWDFLDRNRKTLAGNPRLSQAYRTFDRMNDSRRAAVRRDAKAFLDSLEQEPGGGTGSAAESLGLDGSGHR